MWAVSLSIVYLPKLGCVPGWPEDDAAVAQNCAVCPSLVDSPAIWAVCLDGCKIMPLCCKDVSYESLIHELVSSLTSALAAMNACRLLQLTRSGTLWSSRQSVLDYAVSLISSNTQENKDGYE